ncbi:tricarballylate utilization 4Fe-4S protein TcuB [Ahrensia kielensis]|uniref:Tricarballylate utilization 4Fe-4S protein TcuB n=1 Tax=Ahrensia kielensis TaxID=76980 RepID=A0ABU9T2R1_9HYPH
MSIELKDEARRQAQICNSCRYCEGFCSVFPAMHRERMFADGDITQLANLCHNCQNCFHACQYTAPHEFDINLPQILAKLRQESWEDHAWPRGMGKAFHRNGTLIAVAAIVGVALLFWAARSLPAGGEGFYAVMSHNVMIAIFLPAFILPLVSLAVGLRGYWRTVGGTRIQISDITEAFGSAAKMRNLSGGHGEGCNFEDEDRFSQRRRVLHQMVMYGFLLCFASTSSGTILHYVFDMPAPYSLLSLPKLLGVSGGVILSLGTLGMMWLKTRGIPSLTDERVRGGEFGFILLLFMVSTTGLLLYLAGGTPLLESMLVVHLGAVLAFFLLTPFSKMAHGFYRLAALIRDAQVKRDNDVVTGSAGAEARLGKSMRQ